MNIKDLLGDEYKDGMTVDEINTALANKNFVDPSTLPKSVKKETYDKVASDLAEAKKELQTLKASSMTDEEKLQQALDAAEATRKEFAIKSTRLDVEKVFVDSGLTENDYKSFIDGIVSEDSTASLRLARGIVNTLTAQKQAAEQSVRNELLGSTPRPTVTTPDNGMTLDDFRKLSAGDRAKYAQEHPDEYRQLYTTPTGGNT